VTQPEQLMFEFDCKRKVLIQWILSLSELGKICTDLDEKKKQLTGELVQLVIGHALFEKSLFEILRSNDPQVAQAILDALPPDVGSKTLRAVIARIADK
jgi:hypothetical protein